MGPIIIHPAKLMRQGIRSVQARILDPHHAIHEGVANNPHVIQMNNPAVEVVDVNISKEKASIYKNIKHLNLIPEDAFIQRTKQEAISAKMTELKAVLSVYASKGVKIPQQVWTDIKALTDSSKRMTVVNAYASLASIYSYLAFRIVGAVAVAGIPQTDALNTVCNIVAAAALFAGEGFTRIPTTIGFQHVILRALSRGPEYYKTAKDEKIKAAGMDFDPTKDIPFTKIKDAARVTTVIYTSADVDQFQKSLYGHFLIENARQDMVVENNSTRRAGEYQGAAREVMDWAGGMRTIAQEAQLNMTGDAVADANALLVVLQKVRDSYQAKACEWLDNSREKFGNREQGSGAALDEYLGIQFSLHARKWQDKIDALTNKIATLSPDSLNQHIRSYYEYLGHRFNFNIIMNYRIFKHVDTETYRRTYDEMLRDLAAQGFGANNTLTPDAVQRIVGIIETNMNSGNRTLSSVFRRIRNVVNGSRTDAELSTTINGLGTVGNALANILMEQLSNEPYRGGIKAGARSDFYDRLGRTYVRTKTAFGSDVETYEGEWSSISPNFKEKSRISFPNADFVGSYDKDYVPMSIDPYTGEYVDIFRHNIPMYKKWSMEDGRVNISLVQNLQINANYQLEGPLDVMGERMFSGQPLEPVAKGSESDQQPWYGAHVLPIVLDNVLNAHVRDHKSADDFLTLAANRLYTQLLFIKDKKQVDGLVAAVRSQMGSRLEADIDRTTGTEIIERIKNYAQEKVISTGIGPGRGYYGSMFSCGTCELEYVPGMLLGYDRPYVQTMDGKILGQMDIRYNDNSGRMEIFDYQPRFSRHAKYGAEESAFMEKREVLELSSEERARIEAEYAGSGYGVKIVNNRVELYDPNTSILQKVVFWYSPTLNEKDLKSLRKMYSGKFNVDANGNDIVISVKKTGAEKWRIPGYAPTNGVTPKTTECRKVEMDYSSYEGSGTVVRDYNLDGSCYESRIPTGKGRENTETVYATQENYQAVVASLYNTRQFTGEPFIFVNQNNPREVVIKINTIIPDVEARYISADGKYNEQVQTPSVYQPDKWITEDMATTYWHKLTGWETEIQPVEVGRALGPSDYTDFANMHRRWFKGGPEVEKDFQVELDYNKLSAVINRTHFGYFMNQAKKWPATMVTDILLYGMPAAFWAGLYTLPKGLNPLSVPELFIPVFAVYLSLSLGMYLRPMGQLRNSIKDIWYKEALLRMTAPAYVDAWFLAQKRQPLDWDATKAGDRKMLPLQYLKGIAWRRELSRFTTLFGMGITTGVAMTIGVENMPSPLATMSSYMLNWAFSMLNTNLLDSGVNRFYGYWTSFNDLAVYNAQLSGRTSKEVKVANGPAANTRTVTVTADNERQLRKAVNYMTGKNLGSYAAKFLNLTVGNLKNILLGGRFDARPYKKTFGTLGRIVSLATGNLIDNSRTVIYVNDAARLDGDVAYGTDGQKVTATFNLAINENAKQFRYNPNNIDERVWINGDYYFNRDILIQIGGK